MNVIEWYVGFWPRTSLRSAIRTRAWTAFGHVEAWGYTRDETWMFFDPRHDGTIIRIAHAHDEVEALLADKLLNCVSVLKTPYFGASIGLPFHPMMTCASQVGHLLGIRAYAPRTLHRILRQNGAMEIKDAGRAGERG